MLLFLSLMKCVGGILVRALSCAALSSMQSVSPHILLADLLQYTRNAASALVRAATSDPADIVRPPRLSFVVRRPALARALLTMRRLDGRSVPPLHVRTYSTFLG